MESPFSGNIKEMAGFTAPDHQARSQGGAAGAAAPPPPWRSGGPFSARAARRKGPMRPREAQFLESLEVLRATRALSERPEKDHGRSKGPCAGQRAPWLD